MNKSIKKRLELNRYAMEKSFERLEKAITVNDDKEIYASIGELLVWTITTEEWHKRHTHGYKRRKNKDENGIVLYGVLFAYNAFKHNMEFIEISKKVGGVTLPLIFPVKFTPIDVLWVKNVKIKKTPGEIPKQRKNYEKYLSGENVLVTFENVLDFLEKENKKTYN